VSRRVGTERSPSEQRARRRELGLVVALPVVLALLTMPFASAAASATRLHTYTAFEHGRLAPGLIVRASVRGYCWTLSAVESRPYTWRCLHGNYIHDPCFSTTPTSKTVVCPDAPWSNRVLLLTLTKPLPTWHTYTPSTSPSTWPWGIITLGGKHCTSSVAAATGTIDGKQITYVCQGGGVLAGFTHHTSRTWTIEYAPGFGATRLTRVTITDAWLE
jgi:hypothetical protein